MPSNKTSSRKPKAAAEGSAPLPETATTSPAAKVRKTKASSTPEVTKNAAPAKRHRKAVTMTAVDDTGVTPLVVSSSAAQAEVGEMAPKLKAMAAASGSSLPYSDVVESVGDAPEPLREQEVVSDDNAHGNIRYEDIASLAHSYWAERGYQHGSHEEDWLRAEQELKSRK